MKDRVGLEIPIPESDVSSLDGQTKPRLFSRQATDAVLGLHSLTAAFRAIGLLRIPPQFIFNHFQSWPPSPPRKSNRTNRNLSLKMFSSGVRALQGYWRLPTVSCRPKEARPKSVRFRTGYLGPSDGRLGAAALGW